MSAHTPGPWQHSVKLSASENHRGFSIWTADGWALADVQPADENGIEGEANARLIAAAPLLYEACKTALGIVWFGKEHDQIAAAIKAVEENT